MDNNLPTPTKLSINSLDKKKFGVLVSMSLAGVKIQSGVQNCVFGCDWVRNKASQSEPLILNRIYLLIVLHLIILKKLKC